MADAHTRAIAQETDRLQQIRRIRRALIEKVQYDANGSWSGYLPENRFDPTVAEAARLAGMTFVELTVEVHAILDKRLTALEEGAEKKLAALRQIS